MSDITLTASMRSNLLSLKNTTELMSTTQNRLSTGLKVNSAIDNPSSYYTAQSLNNRANDLSALMDSMTQGIQTVKAANEGIEAITSLVEQAKSIANSARDTTTVEERAKYEARFNEIRSQIDELAGDAGYKGVNLIDGDDTLKVRFNEYMGAEGTSIEIQGVNLTCGEDLAIDEADDWDNADISQGNTAIDTALEGIEAAISTLREVASDFGSSYSIIETRQEFTENLINVLTEGADDLTLADMNEESANMLALQTRQQLAINALSLSSQASQSVLSLF